MGRESSKNRPLTSTGQTQVTEPMKEAEKERSEGRRSPGEYGSMKAKETGHFRKDTSLSNVGVLCPRHSFPFLGPFGFIAVAQLRGCRRL